MPRTRRYTDDQLRAAVPECKSMRELCAALSLRPGGGTYRSLRRQVARLGLDLQGYPAASGHRGRTVPQWTDEELRTIVAASSTFAEVQRTLGYRPSGGVHRYLRGEISRVGASTEHFRGQAWAQGRRRPARGPVQPLDAILVRDSTYGNSSRLRERLIASGLKTRRREVCGIAEWQGVPLPLALDHINGDPRDNRLQNLRILCPNCHALTDTWCGRNRGRRTPTGREVRLRT